MPESQARVTYLTGSISRAAGGLFDAVRNLALGVDGHGRYAPSVLGLDDSHASLDRPLWRSIAAEAFEVRGPRAFGYAPGLLKALQRQDPDLLHVHGLWMYPSLAAIRWSRRSRPYLVSPHGMLDSWALDNARWKKRVAATIYENRHLHGAACLHALNAREAESIRAYGLANPVCVIPNGVEFPQAPEPPSVRDTRTLLYLGRLHPKKGLVALIEAWAGVQKSASQMGWRLKIAGWDQLGHGAYLEELAKKLGASATISFPGPQFGDAKTECFNQADAFILPSLSEGLPMTILEAWSWRLPVLMTPQCNLPEGGQSGAALQMEHDVESIAAALSRLFSMSCKEREAMGANGRCLVKERFQWPQVVQQMTEVYDWILGKAPQPACVLN